MDQRRTSGRDAPGTASFSPLPVRAATPEPAPAEHPRLEPKGELGRGRTCRVILALDRLRGGPVAARMVHDRDVPNEEVRAMFLREMRLVESVPASPHLIRIYEVIDCPEMGCPLQLLEYAPGGTLEAFLESNRNLDLAETLPVARKIVEGPATLHAAGIVHGNVTPSNFVYDGQVWKLIDFSCATVSRQNPSDPGERISLDREARRSPYLPPELLDGRGPGLFSMAGDVYGLGLILLQLFYSPARRLCLETPTWERAVRIRDCTRNLSGVPESVRLLLIACLELEPGCRFADAGEVREGLDVVAAGWDGGDARREAPRDTPLDPDRTFQGAREAFAQSRMERAEAGCRAVLGHDPGHAGARALLAELVERKKRAGQLYTSLPEAGHRLNIGEKLARFEEASRVYPGHPGARMAASLLRAEAATFNGLVRESWESAKQGLFDGAIHALDRASSLHPGAPGLPRARELAVRIQASWRLLEDQLTTEDSGRDSNSRACRARALDQFLSGRAVQLLQQLAEHLHTIEIKETNHVS